MKRALVTGITGMDGSYLAELLLAQGYQVWGLVRRCSTRNTDRIEHLLNDLILLQGDMTDPVSLDHVVKSAMPELVVNLAAMSFVGESWRQPLLTFSVVATGTANLLESVRRYVPEAKFYQASSSEQFGSMPPPQNELTNFHPRSPYGVSKTAAHWWAVNYRESYNMNVSCGILFNHSGARRGIEFVERKVSHGVAQIVKKRSKELLLGNLDAKRDWGHSKDYMRAAMLMTDQKIPDDYVIGTGIAHSVQNLVETAFRYVNLDWREYVKLDERFLRPAEVNHLLADPRKAKEKLGWTPTVTFADLVAEMVEYDLATP